MAAPSERKCDLDFAADMYKVADTIRDQPDGASAKQSSTSGQHCRES